MSLSAEMRNTESIDVDGLEPEDAGLPEAYAEQAAPSGGLGGECRAGAGLDGAGGSSVGQGEGGPERARVRDWPAYGLGREGQAGSCGCGRCRCGDRGGDDDAVAGLGWREAGDGSGGEAEGDHGRGPQRREAKRRW